VKNSFIFTKRPPENGVSVLANVNKFCESAQSALRSTASNYDVKLLVIGLITSAAALLTTLATLGSSFLSPTQPGIFMTLVVIFYGVMMFASSYVEEEQHFWYWTASAWFFGLYINRYVSPTLKH
jgi:ethanolamine phosphate transferase 2 subunit G